jgi:hypothetical protein
MNDWPTTRRIPRTINEAFPSGYAYAASVERQRRRRINFWRAIKRLIFWR